MTLLSISGDDSLSFADSLASVTLRFVISKSYPYVHPKDARGVFCDKLFTQSANNSILQFLSIPKTMGPRLLLLCGFYYMVCILKSEYRGQLLILFYMPPLNCYDVMMIMAV